MKQFQTLDEAFHHQSNCPFCHKVITKGWAQMTFDGGETLVEFDLGKTSVTLDYKTGDLREYKTSSPFEEIATRSYPVYASNGSAHSAQRNGKELFRVICACTECSQYTYVLQIHLDMDKRRVVGIFLNSETLSIEKGTDLHEIKNVYATNKTEYSTFTNYESDDIKTNDRKSIVLPLIPMDLSNPTKTLDRIKTLVLFS